MAERVEREGTAIEAFTTQQLINCRREAEAIIVPEENLYRICWVSDPHPLHKLVRQQPLICGTYRQIVDCTHQYHVDPVAGAK